MHDDRKDPMECCLDYVQAVNSNISAFLRDKSKAMNITLENVQADFKEFWQLIGAQGDYAAATKELQVAYNQS